MKVVCIEDKAYDLSRQQYTNVRKALGIRCGEIYNVIKTSCAPPFKNAIPGMYYKIGTLWYFSTRFELCKMNNNIKTL
jgi:hypothetical protein